MIRSTQAPSPARYRRTHGLAPHPTELKRWEVDLEAAQAAHEQAQEWLSVWVAILTVATIILAAGWMTFIHTVTHSGAPR